MEIVFGPHKNIYDLITEKQTAIQNSVSRGNPIDDLKSAGGEIYNSAKRILQLTGCGNDTKSFMRDTLSPLVKSGMKVYEELKKDVFN